MTESKRTSLLLSHLRKTYPSGFFWKINDRSRGGVPDALLMLDRGHIWVEFKNITTFGQNPHNGLTELQRVTLDQFNHLGQDVYVVGLLPNGEQNVWFFGDTAPAFIGETALAECVAGTIA